jgi:hypothetical protein
MTKRKANSDSEEEAQLSDASSEPKQKIKAPATKAANVSVHPVTPSHAIDCLNTHEIQTEKGKARVIFSCEFIC